MPKIMLNSVEYTGGGGDSGMELTYDEYLALPEEEKTNGTTYYVKDINGAGKDQFQPVIYSEEEREIGVWMDGKPLYEKTIHTGAMTTDTSWHTIPHNIENMETPISAYGYVKSGTEGYWYSIPQYRANTTMGVTLELTLTTINYVQNWLNRAVDSYVTLQYTKTTDQLGSGTWTPQGVPAVHYDDTEKVVGTWFGETLYEISTICDVSASSSTWSVADFNVNMDDINVITEVKGAFCRTQDKWTVALNYYESSNSWSTHNIVKNATTGKASLNYKSYAGAGKVYVTLRYTKSTS